ncbi:MAG TPA: DEAD/DEAH box helicase family protein [Thermoanaerobaculia bacterium]|nr:DEAD/DEAH box helicase family protein [Thermoanaerobaculia bacterium]
MSRYDGREFPETATLDASIPSEVARAVLDTGGLTKDEVREAWGLGEEEYRELQRRLADHPEIEPGPQGTGGFLARRRRGRLPEETAGKPVLLRADWETQTVERLVELLQHADLEELLGHLLYTLRQARKEAEGVDRRGTKRELASALVLQHGVDLFGEPRVREAVARAAGSVEWPRRWHPGKPSANEFVERVSFPQELAGVPAPESPPDLEYLEGRFRLQPLQPFQKEVQRGVLETLQEPIGRRCIVALPTGSGKTRVAVESIAYWMFDRYDRERELADRGTALWLAHTEELCEQACACFRQVWESHEDVVPTTLVRFWGAHTQDLLAHHPTLRQALQRPGVLVTTPHRLLNLLDGKTRGSEAVLADLVTALGLIVVDEAHRAAAPSYRRILETLAPPERPVSVVGLTATPFRMEYLGDDPEEGTRELKEIFHRLVEPVRTLGVRPRITLQEMGVLARPVFDTLRTPTTIRLPDPPASALLSEQELERLDRVLAIRTDNTPRRLVVFQHLLPLARDPAHLILYFGPSVRDAECMAFLLRQAGVPAAVISGTTRDVTRRQVVGDFKQGELRVLCNCEVLTTGFDAPRVTHVVMARPTVSRVLYEQIVGRGLRGPKFGGTETCVVVDCEDNYRGERPPMGYEAFRRVWYGRAGR